MALKSNPHRRGEILPVVTQALTNHVE
jgi:hypothetical protein